MKKCIISVKMDVTRWMPEGWEKMSEEELKEWLGDTPEVFEECFNEDGLYVEEGQTNFVKKIEKI